MQPSKLKKTTIDSLQPQSKPYVLYDTEAPGFGVRVGKASKVFIVQKRVGGRIIKRTIGKYGIYSVEQARVAAKKILYELSQGNDPLEEKRRIRARSELTFEKLFEKFLSERTLKASTVKEYRSRLPRLLGDWFPMPANAITREMVRRRFEELMAHPTQAGIVIRYARAVFNFGIEYYRNDDTGESEIKQNPIEVITRGRNKKMPKPKRRQGYLKKTELPLWFEAIDSLRETHDMIADYLIITLLLGARRTETAKLRWEDVDLDERMVIFRDPKNHSDHYIPLANYVFDIFQRRREAAPDEVFVFPARSKVGYLTEPRAAMAAIKAATGIVFIMHDLRRTFGTYADELNLQMRTIKRMMNHIDNQNDVTLGYIINETNRLRPTMQAVEDHILKHAAITIPHSNKSPAA